MVNERKQKEALPGTMQPIDQIQHLSSAMGQLCIRQTNAVVLSRGAIQEWFVRCAAAIRGWLDR